MPEEWENFAASMMLRSLALIFIVAPLTALGSLIYWLKNKIWPDWSLHGFGINAPLTQWLGVNYILDGLFRIHLGWLIFVVGMITFFICDHITRKADAMKRQHRTNIK